MKPVAQGFSLIELMIVVAIIGILAVVAIPSYQTYANKAKFTEVVHATAPFKLAVETCLHEQGSLSACVNQSDGSGQNGIPPAINNPDSVNSYVKTVSVQSEDANSNQVRIVATSQHIGKKNNALSYILTASYQDNGQILWEKDPKSSCVSESIC